jgi:hypothetical protein
MLLDRSTADEVADHDKSGSGPYAHLHGNAGGGSSPNECVFSYALTYSLVGLFYANGFNQVRPLYRDVPEHGRDWFRPLILSCMIYAEDDFRSKIGFPSLLKDGDDRLYHVSFSRFVKRGDRNPLFSWEDSVAAASLPAAGSIAKTADAAPDAGDRPGIGSVKLQTDHQELFHYTGPDVLKHIVRCNTIWATHFRDLSDSKEITVLKEPLYHELVKLFDEAVAARGRDVKRRFKHYGGAPPQARKFVDSIYKATFEIDDPNRAVDAFTTSFSTHSADSEYERENGLEGQWECYGKDGFCIVFDTAQMCRIEFCNAPA